MASLFPSNWSVPDSIRRRVGDTAGKQRIIVEEGHVLVILHAIPSASEPSRREARLFLRSPSGEWQVHPRTLGRGLAALRAHVDTFHSAADAFESEIESAQTADDWFAVLRELSPFVRTVRHLERVLGELRTELGPDPELIAARDRAVDVERTAELVHQWASQGLDYTTARTNEEQAKLADFISRSSHRLNLLAAATLPLTAVGSFFGVNLESGLEHVSAPSVFWMVGGLAVGLGLLIRGSMPIPPPTLAPPKSKAR